MTHVAVDRIRARARAKLKVLHARAVQKLIAQNTILVQYHNHGIYKKVNAVTCLSLNIKKKKKIVGCTIINNLVFIIIRMVRVHFLEGWNDYFKLHKYCYNYYDSPLSATPTVTGAP